MSLAAGQSASLVQSIEYTIQDPYRTNRYGERILTLGIATPIEVARFSASAARVRASASSNADAVAMRGGGVVLAATCIQSVPSYSQRSVSGT